MQVCNVAVATDGEGDRQSGPGSWVSRPASNGEVYSSIPQRWAEPVLSGVAPNGTMNVP